MITIENRQQYQANPGFSAAYRATADRFGLRARQRDLLDASPAYATIMRYAAAGDWKMVATGLVLFGIATRDAVNAALEV